MLADATTLSDISTPGAAPLDLASLLQTVAGEEPVVHIDEGVRTGHVHLHVGSIERGLAFYRDVLGFEVRAVLPASAAFVSAGGYHHHLGFKVWRGEGVGPAPAGAVGLREWRIELPGESGAAAVRARVEAAGLGLEPRPDGFLVRDPWGIAVVVAVR